MNVYVPFMMGISDFIKEATQNSLAPFGHRRTVKKVFMNQKEGLCRTPESLEPLKSKFLFFISHPVYIFVTIAQQLKDRHGLLMQEL